MSIALRWTLALISVGILLVMGLIGPENDPVFGMARTAFFAGVSIAGLAAFLAARKHGRIIFRNSVLTRQENPITFWMAVSLSGLLAVVAGGIAAFSMQDNLS